MKNWQELGQFQTIAIGPSGAVYDGHQRLNVLRAAYGLAYRVTALQSSRELTEQERERLTIEAHVGAVGQFDWDALAAWDTDALQGWGMDADALTQWRGDVAALGNMLEAAKPEPSDAEPQIDRAAELQEKWQTATGQLWRVGEHRLACGDCTELGVIDLLMQGERADCVFTDPPYGVSFQGKGGDSIAGDTTYAIIPIIFAICAEHVMNDKAWVYMCGGSSNMGLYAKLYDYYFHSQVRIVVWDKGDMILRHNGYHSCYEFIYFGFTRGAGDWWFGDRAGEAATDVWHVKKPSGVERTHLTEKPVELPARAIGNSCPPSGIVFEPFCGTGSTIIACQNLNRRCRAIEISPAYVAVALQRMSDAFPGIEIERIE